MPLVVRALALFLASFPFARLSLAEPVEARTMSGAPHEASVPAVSRMPIRLHFPQMVDVAAAAAPAAQPVRRQAPRPSSIASRRGTSAAYALAGAAARHGARLRALLVRRAAVAPGEMLRVVPLALATPYPYRAGALLASIQVRAPCRA